MKKVKNMLSITGAVVLVAMLIGCASTKQTENLLSAAGFKMVPADTPQREAHLKALPPNKITMTHRDGQTYFVYPDSAQNVLYIGQQAEYNQYQNLRLQSQLAQERLNAAAYNANWSVWGPWGTALSPVDSVFNR